MLKYKISIVSYLNTIPFIYGINHSNLKEKIELILDYPSICADRLISNKVDIALVPVVILNEYPQFNIISNYCIGSSGKVDTVCLYSEVPLDNIKQIHLDYQSRTSIELLKVLCKEYWKINPELITSNKGFEDNISNTTAALVIGDRAFSLNQKYPYIYDLSENWKSYTGFPFVFACWASNKSIDKTFIKEFNKSISYGVNKIEESILDHINDDYVACNDPLDYLNNKISYIFDDDKRKGMDLFLRKINF